MAALDNSESSTNTSNLEDRSLLAGGARVKFEARWLGDARKYLDSEPGLRLQYESVCAELSTQMLELERLGVTPVAPDGKVSTKPIPALQTNH